LPASANVGHSDVKNFWRSPSPGTLLSPNRRSSIPTVDCPPITFIWDHKWPVLLDGDELTELLSSEDATNAGYWRHPYKHLIRDAISVLADRHKRLFDLLRGGELVAEGIHRDTGQELTLPHKEWDRTDRYLHVRDNDLFKKDGENFDLTWESLSLGPPNSEATAGLSSAAASTTDGSPVQGLTVVIPWRRRGRGPPSIPKARSQKEGRRSDRRSHEARYR
jgi:hypothetical protein